jgi:hypothetical protein
LPTKQIPLSTRTNPALRIESIRFSYPFNPFNPHPKLLKP